VACISVPLETIRYNDFSCWIPQLNQKPEDGKQISLYAGLNEDNAAECFCRQLSEDVDSDLSLPLECFELHVARKIGPGTFGVQSVTTRSTRPWSGSSHRKGSHERPSTSKYATVH
jgi:hypothetical protein